MRLKCERDAKLGAFFRKERQELALRFAEIATTIPRWRTAYHEALGSDRLGDYAEAEFEVYARYLEAAFRTGDGIWLELYVGEKIKQSHALDGDFAAARRQIETVLHDELDYLVKQAASCGQKSVGHLTDALAAVRSVIVGEAKRRFKVLWIADCLYLDIQSFLSAGLAEAALAIEPDLVTTKDPVGRYEQIAALLAANTYDAVFFCPFGYENDGAYSRLFRGKAALMTPGAARKLADGSMEAVEPTLRLLSERTDCPVFVHNASGVLRHAGGLKERLKEALSRPQRAAFCRTANARLNALLDELNGAKAAGQAVLVDEFALAQKEGPARAGRYFHRLGQQHPARLGLLLAPVYLDILVTIQSLLKKKVVVCDLDNTLWDGVIGEGAVSHFADRQAILKSLKRRGVVLAINSKNDPKNVTWDGAVLQEDDFAATRINWNTKAENMGELIAELNLGGDSIVFVDDRADERAMVKSVFPDVLALDADDPVTWRRFALWSHMLSSAVSMDRTRTYRERRKRNSFVTSNAQLSKMSLFGQLDLRCTVSASNPKDLPRIAELLNRTNQFNTTGRRVTLKEVQSWHESRGWSVYSARARDRFGDMGLVSVLAARHDAERIEIEAFVLSCRVFGYGIETAVLKALIERNPGKIVSGRIVPTPVNQPCQAVYRDHGFREIDGFWVFDHNSAALSNKEWLAVESDFGDMAAE